jgi:hypothetical protein
MERLIEAFQLSQMLAAVHQAVSYQHIMAHVEAYRRQKCVVARHIGYVYFCSPYICFVPLRLPFRVS